MQEHPDYEVFEEVGRGATSTIHRAKDLSLGRDVAVKVIHDHLRSDPRRLQEFFEEARFLAGLSHPHIVQVYGIERNLGWIVMELMRGSLDRSCAAGPMPPQAVRAVLQQLLDALSALHRANKIHGAVHPNNMLLDEQGRVKLTDSAGASIGGEVRKPAGGGKYLAPEMLNPQFGKIGPSLDLYCLGFSALELLAGPNFASLFKQVQFDPETAWARVHASDAEPLPRAAEIAPGIPPDLAQVIDRLVCRRVADRFPTAEAALDALGRAPAAPAPAAAPAQNTPYLQVLCGPEAGKRFHFNAPGHALKVGRSRGVDILSMDPFVSVEHAVVAWDGSRFTLTDRSLNGTYLDGKRIAGTVEMAPGQEIWITAAPMPDGRLASTNRIALGAPAQAARPTAASPGAAPPKKKKLKPVQDRPMDAQPASGSSDSKQMVYMLITLLIAAAAVGLLFLPDDKDGGKTKQEKEPEPKSAFTAVLLVDPPAAKVRVDGADAKPDSAGRFKVTVTGDQKVRIEAEADGFEKFSAKYGAEELKQSAFIRLVPTKAGAELPVPKFDP